MLFMIVNLSTAFTQLKYEVIYCVWYYSSMVPEISRIKLESSLEFWYALPSKDQPLKHSTYSKVEKYVQSSRRLCAYRG